MSCKVDNAIILAAGMSSRFAPLSYEKPKGLINVRGEVLIERQVRQLKEVGINEIIVVTGYKSEEYQYLKEKFGVIIVENKDYQIRNNSSSIYVAREYLKNTYICSSDNYFLTNPFESTVSESYYAARYGEGHTNEWCIEADNTGRITRVQVGGFDSWYMLGHVFWSQDFSEKFINILLDVYHLPETYDKFWEDIYKENIDKLSLALRKYPDDYIFEFDTLEELRLFDTTYINNSGSKILETICNQLNCSEGDITNITPIKNANNDVIGISLINNSVKYDYNYQTALLTLST